MNLKQRAKQLKKDIPAVFLALKHKQTPVIAKVVAGITVGYALSPIDLIPDFIPILGYLDDLILLPALAAITIKLIPKEVMRECREKSENLWADGKPKKWYYAIPIVLFWLIIVWLIVKAIWF
ncbi:MAG: YkvA family protein [Oscillospiraceae bacterium]